MSRFVPEDLQAPFGRAAFDLEHLRLLEPHQPRVREVERDRDAGHAVRREPLCRQPEVRPETEAARGQLVVQLRDAWLEPAARDRQAQLAKLHIEQRFVVQIRPVGADDGRRACRRPAGRSDGQPRHQYESHIIGAFRLEHAVPGRRLVVPVWPCTDDGRRSHDWHAFDRRERVARADVRVRQSPPARRHRLPVRASLSGQSQAQTPPPPPPAKPVDPQEVNYKETVVVSASKTEQQLIDAPATMSVIGPRQLAVAPTTNYAELLRTVPGVNITQISARDVNVTSRGATSSLATSQLTVVDGRSVYQDFFGFTMWEFVPNEARRDQADRGHPRPGVGHLGRQRPERRRQRHHQVAARDAGHHGDVWRRRRSTARSTTTASQPARCSTCAARTPQPSTTGGPTSSRPACTRRTRLRARSATSRTGSRARRPIRRTRIRAREQPKFDARVDYDFADRTQKLSVFWRHRRHRRHHAFRHRSLRHPRRRPRWATARRRTRRTPSSSQAFINVLDGEATNLVSTDPSGTPIGLIFDTKTFDVEAGDTRVVAAKHVLTYGGNLRFNKFNLTIAPGRGLTHRRRRVHPGRVPHQRRGCGWSPARASTSSRSIDNAVFSPRLAVVFKPKPEQSIRVTYNRAFRAPSMINNNLDTTIGTPLPLGAVNPAYGSAVYYVPTRAVGNPDLTEEHIDAFEISYSAQRPRSGDDHGRLVLQPLLRPDSLHASRRVGTRAAAAGVSGARSDPRRAGLGRDLRVRASDSRANYTYENLGKVTEQGPGAGC